MSEILDVNPTRMELLKLKQKKVLAEKGYGLLKNKQDALIMKFFEKVKELKKVQEDVSSGVSSAFESLLLAQTLDGVPNVKSAVLNYPSSFELDVSRENIMGVRTQKISIKKKEMSVKHLGGSNQLIETRHKFIDALVSIVKFAELEDTLIKLAEDIKKTKRKLNSLEYIRIPKLANTYNYINMILSEQERENFSRLKHIKQKLEEA